MKTLLLTACAAVALAACGGGGDGGEAPDTSCAPNGTQLVITANGLSYDKDCLAAPAGQAFELHFNNKDAGQLHNVSIYTDESADEELFKGELITGVDETTYNVDALDAGTYYFRCDAHPGQMNGGFVVK